MTPGPSKLAWQPGLNLKKGLICKFVKFGTVLQFLKDWAVFKRREKKGNKNWTVLEIKLGLFAIKNKIWTYLQKVK